jgi:hypothetical protein
MNKPTAHWVSHLLPQDSPEGASVWKALQARLLQLAEQDERGGADVLELHRLVAGYDLLRSAALRPTE